MGAEQTAYLATCGLMFSIGLAIFFAGVLLGKIFDGDWTGLVIGIGFLCMVTGPLMLMGFPQEAAS